jgi:hypothetical protein
MSGFSSKRAPRLFVIVAALLTFAGILLAFMNNRVPHFSQTGAADDTFNITRQHEARALANARNDELEKLLQSSTRLSLHGGPTVKTVSRLRIGMDASFYLLDAPSRLVEKLDSSGQFLLRIGNEENKIGHLIFPSDIDVGEQELLISDFKQSRISRYSFAGEFLSSFSTAGERFSAKNVFSTKQHDVFVCGNRYSSNFETVHRYSSSGKFQNSLLPLTERQRELNLDAFNDCLTTSTPYASVVTFPFEYKLYQVGEGGAIDLGLSVPVDFRPPSRPLIFTNHSPEEFPSIFETWKAEWTPIENIAGLADGRVVVQYRTFNPLRYSVEVWNLATKKRERSFHTNYRLLTVDPASRMYFESLQEAKETHDILTGVLAN